MNKRVEYTAMAEFPRGHGWTYLTATGSCGRGRAILYGCIIRVSVTGAQVTFYDGQDASGRVICVLEGLANVSFAFEFAGGIRLEKGLYINLGTNVDEVLVVWDAADREYVSQE